MGPSFPAAQSFHELPRPQVWATLRVFWYVLIHKNNIFKLKENWLRWKRSAGSVTSSPAAPFCHFPVLTLLLLLIRSLVGCIEIKWKQRLNKFSLAPASTGTFWCYSLSPNPTCKNPIYPDLWLFNCSKWAVRDFLWNQREKWETPL